MEETKMKILIVIGLILILAIGIFLNNIKNKSLKEYPYMDKEFLHINENRSIPLENIVGTEIISDPVAHVIIHYELENHAGGMFSIELWQYKKLLRDMLHE